MSTMLLFMLSFILRLARLTRSNLLRWISINRTTWIVAIISSLTLLGSWRCRSMVVNTIRRSHHFGSRIWWTTFQWVRWWTQTSPLLNSTIRARSLLSQVSSSLVWYEFLVDVTRCSILTSNISTHFRTDLHTSSLFNPTSPIPISWWSSSSTRHRMRHFDIS